MPLTKRFLIEFNGAIQEGWTLDGVKANLGRLFQTEDSAEIDRLFLNTPKILKQNLSREEALKFQQSVENTGAYCRILEDRPEAADVSPPQQRMPNEHSGRGKPARAANLVPSAHASASAESQAAPESPDILDVPWRESSKGQKIETLFRPCETCGRDVGPDMLECDERQNEQCPFEVFEKRGSRSKAWLFPFCSGILLLLYGLSSAQFLKDFFLKQEIEIALPAFPTYPIDAWWWIFPLGLLTAFVGWRWGKHCYTDLIRFYNRNTGEVAEWTRLLGRTRERLHISAYERIAVPGGESLPYPASVSLSGHLPQSGFSMHSAEGMRKEWDEFAAEACYLTLVQLLSREVLTLYRAGLIEMQTSGRNTIRPLFLIGPGPQNHVKVKGRLEHQLLEAVNHLWTESQRREWFLMATLRASLLIKKGGSNVIIQALGRQTSVGKSIAGEFLIPDASERGLLEIENTTHPSKVSVQITPEQAEDFTAVFQRLKENVNAFETSHPLIAKALRREVRDGVASATERDND